MQVQTYGNQGVQGGTGIPKRNEDMPGKSLNDLFSLKAKPFPYGTLACDFSLKTHEIGPQGKFRERTSKSKGIVVTGKVYD